MALNVWYRSTTSNHTRSRVVRKFFSIQSRKATLISSPQFPFQKLSLSMLTGNKVPSSSTRIGLLVTVELHHAHTRAAENSQPPTRSTVVPNGTFDSRHGNLLGAVWCPRQELNLQAFRHTVLSRACLPIPPLGPSSRF